MTGWSEPFRCFKLGVFGSGDMKRPWELELYLAPKKSNPVSASLSLEVNSPAPAIITVYAGVINDVPRLPFARHFRGHGHIRAPELALLPLQRKNFAPAAHFHVAIDGAPEFAEVIGG